MILTKLNIVYRSYGASPLHVMCSYLLTRYNLVFIHLVVDKSITLCAWTMFSIHLEKISWLGSVKMLRRFLWNYNTIWFVSCLGEAEVTGKTPVHVYESSLVSTKYNFLSQNLRWCSQLCRSLMFGSGFGLSSVFLSYFSINGWIWWNWFL